MLTVLTVGPRTKGKLHWNCRCDCGAQCVVSGDRLRDNRFMLSCGCVRRHRSPHGESRPEQMSPEYQTWKAMKARCLISSNAGFHLYGARGIKVCDRWMTYQRFLADMGRRPFPTATIDRIDVNGNYEPGNCRWVSRREQTHNMRTNIRLTAFGRTQILADWIRELDLTADIIMKRIRRGMSLEDIIREQPRRRRKA